MADSSEESGAVNRGMLTNHGFDTVICVILSERSPIKPTNVYETSAFTGDRESSVHSR